MVAALQGPQTPQAQAIQAMFAQPTSQLQKMAGDVVPLPIQPTMPIGQLYDRILQQPSGMKALGPLNQMPPNIVPIKPNLGKQSSLEPKVLGPESIGEKEKGMEQDIWRRGIPEVDPWGLVDPSRRIAPLEYGPGGGIRT